MPYESSSPPTPSVLNELRSGTQTLHVALEKRLPFFSDSLDLQRYTRLLAAYYGFYQPLEQALLASGAVPDDFNLLPRLKADTLRADLRALGATADDLPLCEDLPVIDSSAAVSVFYMFSKARPSAGRSCVARSPRG